VLLLVLAACASLLLAAPAAAQEASEDPAAAETVGGTLKAEAEEEGGDPVLVEGAAITVRTAAGDEVGEAETGDDGTWSVDLPGPGEYLVSIDPDSLPDDVELRDDDRAELRVNVRPGQARPVIFALGEDPRDVGTRFDQFLQLCVEGIKFGLIIAMSAVGLSLIFGTTGLVNFAHGELVTFGALVTYYFNVTLGLHLLVAAPIAVVLSGLFGALFDRGFWRPLRERGTSLIALMVVSIGASLALRHIFLYQFGGRTRPFGDYAIQTDTLEYFGVTLVRKDLWIIGVSVLLLVLVAIALEGTRIGKATRAVADNKDLAESSGIDVEKVILVVWAAGTALAAVGGVFLGLSEQVSWLGGFQLLLLMFAGVVLGGLGTAYGALVGSIIVGLAVQMSTLWISSELKNVAALVILALILLVRPQGILGRKERVG